MENNSHGPTDETLNTYPELLKVQDKYTVLYKNIFIYDKNNPAKKIEQKIESIEIKKNSLVLIPSPVLFYGFKELYKKLPENCFILSVEYEKELYELRKKPESDYLSEPETDYICTASQEFFLNFFDTRKELAGIKHIVFLPLNNGYLLHKDFYTESYGNLKKSLKQFLINSLTLYSLGKRYYKNLILNLPSLLKGKDIKELKTDKPVVITGAGESLEKALPLLINNRNLFKIIAIDTSLRTLINFGIIPDYVIAVESQFYNIFDFLGNNCRSIPLIADMTTYPLTSRIFTGEKYYFISDFTLSNFLDMLKEENLLPTFIPPLGSVGITALYISLMISTSFIFYTGLDFSFMLGKTHAKDSPLITDALINWAKLSKKNNYYLSITDNLIPAGELCKKTIYTTPALKSYAETMSNIIAGEKPSLPDARSAENTKNKRIYSLFSSAVVLKNENNVLDEKTFVSMLKSGVQPGPPADGSVSSNSGEDYKQRIKAILENELSKIERVINSGVDFLNGISQSNNQNIIKELAKNSDYLLPQYPTNVTHTTLDSVTVKYILLTCYSFSKTIKNTLTNIR
ncbi:MAG: DUF115 domain-containing protein [Spirochaetes bacterium]|nr:DUF115 domain-containing protein [Spirochaetota bacterium]